jgi:hypothetical protein
LQVSLSDGEEKEFDLKSPDSIVSTLPVLLVKTSTFLTPMIYGLFNPQVGAHSVVETYLTLANLFYQNLT